MIASDVTLKNINEIINNAEAACAFPLTIESVKTASMWKESVMLNKILFEIWK